MKHGDNAEDEEERAIRIVKRKTRRTIQRDEDAVSSPLPLPPSLFGFPFPPISTLGSAVGGIHQEIFTRRDIDTEFSLDVWLSCNELRPWDPQSALN